MPSPLGSSPRDQHRLVGRRHAVSKHHFSSQESAVEPAPGPLERVCPFHHIDRAPSTRVEDQDARPPRQRLLGPGQVRLGSAAHPDQDLTGPVRRRGWRRSTRRSIRRRTGPRASARVLAGTVHTRSPPAGSEGLRPVTRKHARVFELQFPIADVPALAARFPAADETRWLATGAAARARGHYTRSEFIKVCAWKTVRSRPKVAANSARAITRATTRALSPVDEEARIDALLELDGVGVPTASTLLYVAFPDDYPILDVRALESLGMRSRSTYPVSFWLAYLEVCRRIARRAASACARSTRRCGSTPGSGVVTDLDAVLHAGRDRARRERPGIGAADNRVHDRQGLTARLKLSRASAAPRSRRCRTRRGEGRRGTARARSSDSGW